MIEAIARAIAETAADVLRQRTSGGHVSDQNIGQHLWFERGCRNHVELVALINFVREILDRSDRQAQEAGGKHASPRGRASRHPAGHEQLALDLKAS